MATSTSSKPRLATVWLGGCAGCHMSLLDLDERIVDVLNLVDLVYSPIADIKHFPEGVDVTLVEGSVCNEENLHLARELRKKSKLVVAFGDCAVTGNVPMMRNRLKLEGIISAVYTEPFYREGPGPVPQPESGAIPALLPKVVPLHGVIPVDVFLPGCPPSPDRIWAAINAILSGGPIELPVEMRTFG
ncbi:MAG: NADP oxidoreductase [Desulfobacteraceae bacterium]|nr:NADP oxidoreductase [Desulfobacteraceae bacterium]